MKMLRIDEIQDGMMLANNIYAQNDDIVPFLYEKTVLSPQHIQRLQLHGITQVPIAEPSDLLHFEVPQRHIVISRELRHSAIQNLEDIFDIARQGERAASSSMHVIKQLNVVVDQLVDTLLSDQKALININDLKSYDEYTYHHSLSVAVLTIAIANSLGFSREKLLLAGRCAILHDIGKTAIPLGIIQKPDRLTNREFNIIKTHPAEGYCNLWNMNIQDEEMLLGVLCHHERYDGSGYPFGFKQDDIPILSRIICVADVYDAMTSNRPYRQPMQPHEGMDYIMAEAGTMFDYDIVMAFIKKLELYPLGSFVELSNNQLAIVLENANAIRPIIRVISTGEVIDLNLDRASRNVVVRRVVPTEELVQAQREIRTANLG